MPEHRKPTLEVLPCYTISIHKLYPPSVAHGSLLSHQYQSNRDSDDILYSVILLLLLLLLFLYIYILYIFVQFNHFQQWKPPLCALKRIAPTAEPVALRFHLLEGAETLLRLLRLCEALDDGRVDHLGITENHRGSPGHKRWKPRPKRKAAAKWNIGLFSKKSIEI